MDANAYARMLRKLLPQGLLWRQEPDSNVARLCLAIGDELVRVEQRADVLVAESVPSTASETLEDWERVLGLPDEEVTEIPNTTEERRLAIIQKLIRRGGQSASYFQTLALACGWVVYVVDGYGDTVFRVGRSRVGERLYSTAWAFVWRVDVDYSQAVHLTSEQLEAILRKVAPAHTVVFFNYL